MTVTDIRKLTKDEAIRFGGTQMAIYREFQDAKYSYSIWFQERMISRVIFKVMMEQMALMALMAQKSLMT